MRREKKIERKITETRKKKRGKRNERAEKREKKRVSRNEGEETLAPIR